MAIVRCSDCGAMLPHGSLRYVVDITIFADYDGYVDEDKDADIDERIQYLLEAMEEMDPNELEEDVYQELSIVLCQSCRDKFKERFMNYLRPSYSHACRGKETLH